MLVGDVTSDSAQSHAMVFEWRSRCSVRNSKLESMPHTTLTFVIGLIVTPFWNDSRLVLQKLVAAEWAT